MHNLIDTHRPRRAMARHIRGDASRQTAPARRPAALSIGELRAEVLAQLG
jgi:hypothetical protein